MLVQFLSALLAFSSLAAASDPGCDQLIRPLKDRSQIYGKWIFYVGASDSEIFLSELRKTNGSWVEISPLPGSEEFSMFYVDRIGDTCVNGTANSTTTGNDIKVTFYFNSIPYEHIGRHLEAGPGCALWTDEVKMEVNGETKSSRSLFLFTKMGTVDTSCLDVFRKQAKCLNLSPDFFFPATTDVCPEEASATD